METGGRGARGGVEGEENIEEFDGMFEEFGGMFEEFDGTGDGFDGFPDFPGFGEPRNPAELEEFE